MGIFQAFLWFLRPGIICFGFSNIYEDFSGLFHVLRQSGHRFEAVSVIRDRARSFADCLDGRAWELKPPSIRMEWSMEDVVWSRYCTLGIVHRYCTQYSFVSTPGGSMKPKPVSMGQVLDKRSYNQR